MAGSFASRSAVTAADCRYVADVTQASAQEAGVLAKGKILVRAKQEKRAVGPLQRFTQLMPKSVEGSQYYARALAGTDYTAETAKEAERSIRLDSSEADIWRIWAEALVDLKNYPGALKAYEGLKRRTALVNQDMAKYGNALVGVGREEEAFGVLLEATKDTMNCEPFYTLGTLYMKAGRSAQAETAFERALAGVGELVATLRQAGAEVAVVLGDLVLQHRVVAPGVPGQLRDQAVVLVPVVAEVGEDEVGRPVTLERLEVLLHPGAGVGEEAVAVRVDDVVGVAGFLHPGDRVDVIVTMQPRDGASYASKIVLQSVKVLAVGQHLELRGKEAEKANPVTVATLMVTGDDSERLALAAAYERGDFSRIYLLDLSGRVVTVEPAGQNAPGADLHTLPHVQAALASGRQVNVAAPGVLPGHRPLGLAVSHETDARQDGVRHGFDGATELLYARADRAFLVRSSPSRFAGSAVPACTARAG